MPFFPCLLPETEFNEMLVELRTCLEKVSERTRGVSLRHFFRGLLSNEKIVCQNPFSVLRVVQGYSRDA